MIGSVDPFAGTGKMRFRGTTLLGNLATLLVHLDDDARHRLRVSSDQRDLLIGHRFRFLAEQLPTAQIEIGSGMSSARSTNSMGTPANSIHNVRAVVECARARRRDAGARMSDERGCGRDADSNTRDVTSGAAIARGQFARSIKLLGGSCNVALRAAAAALRVGCD